MMNKQSKIYVAGHRGMVGSAIIKALRSDGYDSIITATHAELDLIRQAHVEAFFEKEKPEYVFLAAARVGGILANSTHKAEFLLSECHDRPEPYPLHLRQGSPGGVKNQKAP